MSTTLAVHPEVGAARRWAMLGASTLAQASAAIMYHGPAFLIPALHSQEDLSLATAGLIVATPLIGVMASLVIWGAISDAVGELRVLLIGLALATFFSGVAIWVDQLWVFAVAIGLAGGAAASCNVASGRVVVGWFPPHRRGLAMGIRQMAQPTGVGIAAITMAVVADAHGVHAAIAIPAVACAISFVAVALVVKDPPRPTRTVTRADNPYRGNSFLARIHGVSVLLVMPQFVVWTFALVWLVQERHWTPASAGALIAGAQLAGAFGRIGVGQLSDMVGSRMKPLQWVAVGAAVVMLLLAITMGADWWVAVPLMVFATVLTVADNGLAFTAVAERAGPFWSGRALGIQNTAQFLTGSIVPPLGGAAIGALGFGWTFALAAIFPFVAAPLVPVKDEREVS